MPLFPCSDLSKDLPRALSAASRILVAPASARRVAWVASQRGRQQCSLRKMGRRSRRSHPRSRGRVLVASHPLRRSRTPHLALALRSRPDRLRLCSTPRKFGTPTLLPTLTTRGRHWLLEVPVWVGWFRCSGRASARRSSAGHSFCDVAGRVLAASRPATVGRSGQRRGQSDAARALNGQPRVIAGSDRWHMADDGLVSKVVAIGTFSSCHSHSLRARTVYSRRAFSISWTSSSAQLSCLPPCSPPRTCGKPTLLPSTLATHGRRRLLEAGAGGPAPLL